MKIRDLTEARMGTKELKTTDINDVTIGFEVEIALSDDEGEIDEDGAREYFSDNIEDNIEYPSESEMLNEKYYKIFRMIKQKYKPKFGWSGDLVIIDEDGNTDDMDDYVNENRHDSYNTFIDFLQEHFEKYITIMGEIDDIFEEIKSEIREDAYTDFMNENSEDFRRTVDAEDEANEMLYSAGLIKMYNLDEDPSIKPAGVELVSEVYDNVTEGLQDLKKLFTGIEDHYNIFETNSSCGLHINVGKKEVNLQTMDKLKFLLFMNEGYSTGQFGRTGNEYVRKLLDTYVSYGRNTITVKNIVKVMFDEGGADRLGKEMKNLISDLNSAIEFSHQRTVDFEKLDENYIEVRVAGGNDYHKSYDQIEKMVYRIIRALNISLDEETYKKEYYKKLYVYLRNILNLKDGMLPHIKKVYNMFGLSPTNKELVIYNEYSVASYIMLMAIFIDLQQGTTLPLFGNIQLNKKIEQEFVKIFREILPTSVYATPERIIEETKRQLYSMYPDEEKRIEDFDDIIKMFSKVIYLAKKTTK